MPDTITILRFTVAAILVLIIPGPGFFYILARCLAQGQKAGIVSVLGLSVGALVHVIAATIGLSAILLTSATAFSVLKLLGAAYLIYLGIKVLCSHHSLDDAKKVIPVSMLRLFTDGVLVSVLNPKIAIFFLAFLPQFVDSNLGNIPQQVLIFGLLFVALAFLVDGAFALLAGNFQGRLRNMAKGVNWPRYASGVVYIVLGLGAAFVEPPSSQ
jgi:threonine/homoserine/homoserine lactone efflux protein